MEAKEFVVFLLVGLAAGWIAGKLMRGHGFGLAGNLVVGVLGALAGGFLFRLIGEMTRGIAGSLITATIGAVLVLFVLGQLKKA